MVTAYWRMAYARGIVLIKVNLNYNIWCSSFDHKFQLELIKHCFHCNGSVKCMVSSKCINKSFGCFFSLKIFKNILERLPLKIHHPFIFLELWFTELQNFMIYRVTELCNLQSYRTLLFISFPCTNQCSFKTTHVCLCFVW